MHKRGCASQAVSPTPLHLPCRAVWRSPATLAGVWLGRGGQPGALGGQIPACLPALPGTPGAARCLQHLLALHQLFCTGLGVALCHEACFPKKRQGALSMGSLAAGVRAAAAAQWTSALPCPLPPPLVPTRAAGHGSILPGHAVQPGFRRVCQPDLPLLGRRHPADRRLSVRLLPGWLAPARLH